MLKGNNHQKKFESKVKLGITLTIGIHTSVPSVFESKVKLGITLTYFLGNPYSL